MFVESEDQKPTLSETERLLPMRPILRVFKSNLPNYLKVGNFQGRSQKILYPLAWAIKLSLYFAARFARGYRARSARQY